MVYPLASLSRVYLLIELIPHRALMFKLAPLSVYAHGDAQAGQEMYTWTLQLSTPSWLSTELGAG